MVIFYEASNSRVRLFSFCQKRRRFGGERKFDYDQTDYYVRLHMVTPTRISSYSQKIERVLDFYPNPAGTIPTLPGLVFTINNDNDNQRFMIGNLNTIFLYFVESEGIDILGNTYSMGAAISVRGALSQR